MFPSIMLTRLQQDFPVSVGLKEMCKKNNKLTVTNVEGDDRGIEILSNLLSPLGLPIGVPLRKNSKNPKGLTPNLNP